MEKIGGLSGKSVIVTGGGSGIGRAAALLLGISGCDVTVADMNEAGGNETVKMIKEVGPGRAQFIRTDVSNEAAVQAMVKAAVSAYGKLDGAINSAGVPPQGKPLQEISVDEFDRAIAVNLRGMFLCVKYQTEAMLAGKGGSIVAISSTASMMGLINSSEYCASKAGVNGLIRGGAVDYAARGIRLNAILPGATWTPMSQAAAEKIPAHHSIADGLPMKRWGQPEEIAAGAVWLVSDQASYVTGASMPIDGALSVV